MLSIEAIVSKFDLQATLRSSQCYGSGLIHDSYLIELADESRFVLQQINHKVFNDVDALMHNLLVVTDHLKSCDGYELKQFSIIPTKSGEFVVRSNNESYWRLFTFIPNSYSLEFPKSYSTAGDAARSFGQFIDACRNLSVQELQPVLPEFHNISKSYSELLTTIERDTFQRYGTAQRLVEELLNWSELVEVFNQQKWPKRVIHGDTKLSNVLFDKDSERPIAIVDLDTVMLGCVAFDFGDMVRTFCNPVSEDSLELEKVELDLSVFDELVKGFGEATNSFIEEEEANQLVTGAKMIIWEQAVRFLSDYLSGDAYYDCRYPEHNLDRAKNQLKLLQDLERRENRLEEIVNSTFKT